MIDIMQFEQTDSSLQNKITRQKSKKFLKLEKIFNSWSLHKKKSSHIHLKKLLTSKHK